MESEKQNYGTLQVRAVTARGALPVEGARIYISEDDPENGKTGVIFSGRTNSGGTERKDIASRTSTRKFRSAGRR